jgi:hypothetical protein
MSRSYTSSSSFASMGVLWECFFFSSSSRCGYNIRIVTEETHDSHKLSRLTAYLGQSNQMCLTRAAHSSELTRRGGLDGCETGVSNPQATRYSLVTTDRQARRPGDYTGFTSRRLLPWAWYQFLCASARDADEGRSEIAE